MDIGDIVEVRGLSRKGKNRVNELGDFWRVVRFAKTVQFASGENWVNIAPIGRPEHGRWLKLVGDKDFVITG